MPAIMSVEAREYVKHHEVEERVAEAVASAVRARPADPVAHIGKVLLKRTPALVVDAHFHFFDTKKNAFNSFLGSLGAPPYLPEDYASDALGVPITKTVHVEAMPDNGLEEAKWIHSLAEAGRCKVAAIVGSCNLADIDAAAQLDALKRCSHRVRGIRYIIDYDGEWNGGKNGTHPNMMRHGDGKGVDYLRDPAYAADFERGFAELATRDLSFDLQCHPSQLPAAAELLARHPGVKVVIDHMGKARHLAADGGADDEAKLAEWRAGMKLMAAQPQVHVKLSMLGYSVPGWHAVAEKGELLRSLVREVIDLFGASRCMFASNFHISAAGSDSDGAFSSGLEMAPLYEKFCDWVADYSDKDRQMLFSGTATAFYRL